MFWHSGENQLILYTMYGSILESQFGFIDLYVYFYANTMLFDFSSFYSELGGVFFLCFFQKFWPLHINYRIDSAVFKSGLLEFWLELRQICASSGENWKVNTEFFNPWPWCLSSLISVSNHLYFLVYRFYIPFIKFILNITFFGYYCKWFFEISVFSCLLLVYRTRLILYVDILSCDLAK